MYEYEPVARTAWNDGERIVVEILKRDYGANADVGASPAIVNGQPSEREYLAATLADGTVMLNHRAAQGLDTCGATVIADHESAHRAMRMGNDSLLRCEQMVRENGVKIHAILENEELHGLLKGYVNQMLDGNTVRWEQFCEELVAQVPGNSRTDPEHAAEVFGSFVPNYEEFSTMIAAAMEELRAKHRSSDKNKSFRYQLPNRAGTDTRTELTERWNELTVQIHDAEAQKKRLIREDYARLKEQMLQVPGGLMARSQWRQTNPEWQEYERKKAALVEQIEALHAERDKVDDELRSYKEADEVAA